MQRVDSLEKTLMLGKIEGRRRKGHQRMRCFNDIPDSMDMSLSILWQWGWTGRPGILQYIGHKDLDTTEQLNWTELIVLTYMIFQKVILNWRNFNMYILKKHLPWRSKIDMSCFIPDGIVRGRLSHPISLWNTCYETEIL